MMPRAAGAAPAPPLGTERDPPWDLLLIALAAYVLTAVGRIHQLFGFLMPLRLLLLSSALAIGCYVATGHRARRLAPVLRDPTTRCVLGLAVWMALSIPGALWPGGAFEELTGEFGKMAGMYLVLVAAIRGFKDIERIAFVYLMAVGIYAAVVLSRFGVGGSEWRLGMLEYYDANDFATLAVMALPLGVFFMVRPGPLWRRLVSALVMVFLVTAFVWAGSRGGFLALLAVGGFLLLRYDAIRVRWRVLTTALLVFVFAAVATDTYWEKMRTILEPKDDYNITTEEGRLQVWKRGIGYMLQNPILGVGGGNFPTAEGTISPRARAAYTGRGWKWSVSHNSYVQVGAELGIPGLLLFLLMFWRAFAALRAVQRGQPRSPPAQLAQTLAACLIGYMVGGFFLSLAYRDLLYVLIALAAGLRKGLPAVVASPRPVRSVATSAYARPNFSPMRSHP
jgi:probable O-glycosylation ligase (exosortase A-associated)